MTDAQEKLLDALVALDPNNDTHWTAQGLPAVHVVRDILKDDSITRVNIETVAPGFTRDLAQPEVQKTEEAPALSAAPEQLSREEAEADAKEHILALQQEHRAITDQIRELQSEAAKIIKAQDAVRDELHKKFPPMTDAERFKVYQARSLEDRRRRVENERAAMAVLHGQAKSPLDRAFAAKSTRRPEFPPVTINTKG
jgi:hypothetical protein